MGPKHIRDQDADVLEVLILIQFLKLLYMQQPSYASVPHAFMWKAHL